MYSAIYENQSSRWGYKEKAQAWSWNSKAKMQIREGSRVTRTLPVASSDEHTLAPVKGSADGLSSQLSEVIKSIYFWLLPLFLRILRTTGVQIRAQKGLLWSFLLLSQVNSHCCWNCEPMLHYVNLIFSHLPENSITGKKTSSTPWKEGRKERRSKGGMEETKLVANSSLLIQICLNTEQGMAGDNVQFTAFSRWLEIKTQLKEVH